MGHRYSVLGRHNRARQLRTLIELAALAALIKYAKPHLYEQQKQHDQNPSKFTQFVYIVNNFLRSSLEPWQIILGTFSLLHIYENFSILIGINAPHYSLSTEPDNHYSRNFSRCRLLLTALDAAVLSSLRIRFPLVRHIVSTYLAIYYILRPHEADDKVNQFRNSLTVEHVRACWQKGAEHPILKLIDLFGRPHCKVDGEILYLPRIVETINEKGEKITPNMSPSSSNSSSSSPFPLHQQKTDGAIECRLFYWRDRKFLSQERKLLLHYPGGGFIAMSPVHHADYLSAWALKLKIPILSVNYRKAPEFPFPHGLNDCYGLYEQIVQSNGECLGMNCTDSSVLDPQLRAKPIEIAVVGDSAGGNFAVTVTLKAIIRGIRTPNGVHAIYPSLDMDSEVWRSDPGQQAAPQSEIKPEDSSLAQVPASHTTTIKFTDAHHTTISMKRQPSLSSRAVYAFDGVLPLKYQILLASVLFRDGGDPKNDVLCSPVVASRQLLQHFPPLFIHVGGVDPLCDDSIRFVEKLRLANPTQRVQLHIIPGVSHAYMQITKILPEGRQALNLSSVWIAEILGLPPPLTKEEQEKLMQFTQDHPLKSIKRQIHVQDRARHFALRAPLTFPQRPVDSQKLGEALAHQTIADMFSPSNPQSIAMDQKVSSQTPVNAVTVTSRGSDGFMRISTVPLYSPEAAQLISTALSHDNTPIVRVEVENEDSPQVASALPSRL